MKASGLLQKKFTDQVLSVIGKKIDISRYKVFYFGSRARGDNFARADLDIGVQGPSKISPVAMVEIENGLNELPTLSQIDVVDFGAAKSDFKKEALRTIKCLN